MTRTGAAEIVKETVLACSSALDESVRQMLREADERQAAIYRRLVGVAMGEMFTEVLVPIYRTYPELEPPEIREARLAPRESRPIGSELRDRISLDISNVRSSLAELVTRVRKLADDSAANQLEASLKPTLEALEQIEVFIRRISEPAALG